MWLQVGFWKLKVCNFAHLKSVEDMSDIKKKIENVIVDVAPPVLDGTETLKCSNLRCTGPIRTPLLSIQPNVRKAVQDKDKKLFCTVNCFYTWVQVTRVNHWDEYVKEIEPG